MVVGSKCHSRAALHPGKTRYLLYGWIVGPRTGLDGCGKFDSRTVQRIANRYTDYAIPAHSYLECANTWIAQTNIWNVQTVTYKL